MKKRKAPKFTLNRETVRLLDERESAGVVGAATQYNGCTVNTYACSGCRPCL